MEQPKDTIGIQIVLINEVSEALFLNENLSGTKEFLERRGWIVAPKNQTHQRLYEGASVFMTMNLNNIPSR
jgi:hypothetical protein